MLAGTLAVFRNLPQNGEDVNNFLFIIWSGFQNIELTPRRPVKVIF